MPFTFNKQQMEDVVTGAIVLGSGGGGDVAISHTLLGDVLKVSPTIPFVRLEEVPDDANVCIISAMGSPVATKEHGFDSECCVKALEILEGYIGKKIEYVAAFETGGGNFMPPLYTACRRGLKAIDADGVGRAVPETHMTMLAVNNVPGAPTVMAESGHRSAIFGFEGSEDSERLGRAFTAVLGGASAGVANYVMDGKTAKKYLISGTYARANAVGKAMREAKESGKDPIKALCEATDGVEIIRGTLTELDIEVKHAHDWGYQVIKGSGTFAGKSVKIHLENENIVAFDNDGKVRAITPDLLCVLGADGSPLTNADLKKGMEVSFVGIPCPAAWKDPAAYKSAFSTVLAHFGYTGEYIPVGRLNP